MTPDDFPTRAAYLAYIKECEDSMTWADCETTHNFESVTTPTQEFTNHWQNCTDKEDPYCWCTGDEYGLVYTYTPGMILAQHTTHPMFDVKNDLGAHEYVDDDGKPSCSWCHPEQYYWGPRGGKTTRATAERMWWADQQYVWEGAYTEFFDESNLPRPTYEPHKNGPHP